MEPNPIVVQFHLSSLLQTSLLTLYLYLSMVIEKPRSGACIFYPFGSLTKVRAGERLVCVLRNCLRGRNWRRILATKRMELTENNPCNCNSIVLAIKLARLAELAKLGWWPGESGELSRVSHKCLTFDPVQNTSSFGRLLLRHLARYPLKRNITTTATLYGTFNALKTINLCELSRLRYAS